MDELNRIIERLPIAIYPAKEDSTSNLYKVLLSLGTSIKDTNDNIDSLDDQLNPTLAEAANLDMIASSFNFTRLSLETDASFRLRIKAITLMPKVSIERILDIIGLYTFTRPSIVETGAYTFEVRLAPGEMVSPEVLFGIGPGDTTWGAAIGDEDGASAGATYFSPESGTITSLTYLQALLDIIRPAGTVGTVVQA